MGKREVVGVIGLDLSLRSPAACWLPLAWKGDTRQARMAGRGWGSELTQGASAKERVVRIARIVEGVLSFARANAHALIAVEDYAYAASTSRAAELHELGGAVKHTLYLALGAVVVSVPSATARKTLLQKLPRRDVKQHVADNVRRLGGETPYWNDDQIDAWVVANHALGLAGGVSVSFEGEAYAGGPMGGKRRSRR